MLIDTYNPGITQLSYNVLLCFQLLISIWASLVTRMVKNPLAMQETRVQSLG